MEFTDANKGDRATVHPMRLAVAGHHANGVWHIHRLPDLSPWCTVHSGSAEATLVWHDCLPRVLFYAADSVIFFDLTGRTHMDTEEEAEAAGAGANHRQPNMPDGVIKEARTMRIASARFLHHHHIVVNMDNHLGVRVWSVNKRHEPVLSTSSHVFACNQKYALIVIDKALYVLATRDLSVADKWRLPDGPILSQFIFMAERHHSGRYGILAWQCEEQLQVWALDDGNRAGFKLVAADDSIFAVDNGHAYSGDLLVLPDRTGSFTVMNVLTRALIAKVAVSLASVKREEGVVVFRESRRQQGTVEEAWFDAGYGDMLGAGTLSRSEQGGDVQLQLHVSPLFIAIKHSQLPNLLFLYDLTTLTFRAVLFMATTVTSVQWCASGEVLLSAAQSRHIYSWQPAGARALPHPHGAVEAVEWREGWCLVKGRGGFSMAVMMGV